MSLYVGNLHPDCNDAVLYKKFSLIGEVLSVRVCRDLETGNSLGYGYVNYSDSKDATKAIETMNYDLLFDRNIRIMWVQKDRSKLVQSANVVIKNLDPDKSELDLKDMFSVFGKILSIKVARNCKGESKGYGFVQFEDKESADGAISALNDMEVNGKKLSVSRYIPAEERRRFQQSNFPNNIYVCNLTTTSSEELMKICEAFGDVISAKVVRDEKKRPKGFGYVSFKERESAENAVRELNRLYLNGKRVIAAVARRRQDLQNAV